MLVISGPLALGVVGFFLKRIRGEEFSVANIFDGFQRFLPSFLLMFFYGLFIVLWSLLLIIPGIVKGLGYGMAFYIMYDNPSTKPLEALKQSQAMMKGHRWQYFKLYWSFLGWALLVPLTFGIGVLWLYPYMYLTIGNLYESLKKGQEGSMPALAPTPAHEAAPEAEVASDPEPAQSPTSAPKPKQSGLDMGTWKR